MNRSRLAACSSGSPAILPLGYTICPGLASSLHAPQATGVARLRRRAPQLGPYNCDPTHLVSASKSNSTSSSMTVLLQQQTPEDGVLLSYGKSCKDAQVLLHDPSKV